MGLCPNMDKHQDIKSLLFGNVETKENLLFLNLTYRKLSSMPFNLSKISHTYDIRLARNPLLKLNTILNELPKRIDKLSISGKQGINPSLYDHITYDSLYNITHYNGIHL